MTAASVTQLPSSRTPDHPVGCRCIGCGLLPILAELEARAADVGRALQSPRLVKVTSSKPIGERPPTAVDLLGVGKDLVYGLIRQGDLETVHIGSCQLVVVESIDRYVARLRTEAPA